MTATQVDARVDSHQGWQGWQEAVNLDLPSLSDHPTRHPIRRLTLLRSEDPNARLVVFLPGLRFWGAPVCGASYKRLLQIILAPWPSGPRPHVLLVDYENSLRVSKRKALLLPAAIGDAIRDACMLLQGNTGDQGSGLPGGALRVVLMGHSFGSVLARRVWVEAAEASRWLLHHSECHGGELVAAEWWRYTKGVVSIAGSNLGFDLLNIDNPGHRIAAFLGALAEKLLPQIADVMTACNFGVLALSGRRSFPWIYESRLKWLRQFEGRSRILGSDDLKSLTLYINGTQDALVGRDDLEEVYQLGSFYRVVRLDGLRHTSYLDQPGGGIPSAADFLESNDDQRHVIQQSIFQMLELSLPEPPPRPPLGPSENDDQSQQQGERLLRQCRWRPIKRVSDLQSQIEGETGARKDAMQAQEVDRGERQCVVFLIHGIRDYGDWQENIEYQLRRLMPYVNGDLNSADDEDSAGGAEREALGDDAAQGRPKLELRIVPIRYGYFNALQFLLPSERRRVVRAFSDEYYRVITRYPDLKQENIHVYAHSNGTFVFGEALRQYREIKVNRALIGGSVLPAQFAWSRLLNATGQVKKVLNYAATADMPTGLLCRALSFPWIGRPLLGIGPGGTDGFHDLVNQESKSLNYFLEGDHGATLEPGKQSALRIALYLLLDRECHDIDDSAQAAARARVDAIIKTYFPHLGQQRSLDLENPEAFDLENPLNGYKREDVRGFFRPFFMKKIRANECGPVVQIPVGFGYAGVVGWGKALVLLVVALSVVAFGVPLLAVHHSNILEALWGCLKGIPALIGFVGFWLAQQLSSLAAWLQGALPEGWNVLVASLQGVYSTIMVALLLFVVLIYVVARF